MRSVPRMPTETSSARMGALALLSAAGARIELYASALCDEIRQLIIDLPARVAVEKLPGPLLVLLGRALAVPATETGRLIPIHSTFRTFNHDQKVQ